MEIIPNVHWLKLGYVNVYLCIDDDGLTLIDAGTPNKADTILQAIKDIGCKQEDLKRILITHVDNDHVGSLADLSAKTEATIYASAASAKFLKDGTFAKHLPSVLQFMAERFYKVPAISNTKKLTAGDILPIMNGIQVIATPGHTPDHHSFYSPTHGILFAGDALDTRKGRVNLPPKWITANRLAAKQSAKRLLALTPSVFACGHGKPLAEHSAGDIWKLMKSF